MCAGYIHACEQSTIAQVSVTSLDICGPYTGRTPISSRELQGTFSVGPGDYPVDADCKWLISATNPKDTIIIRFTILDLETLYDFMMINRCASADCASLEEIVRFSNTLESSSTYTSTMGFLQLMLTSDSSISRSGFETQWIIVTSSGCEPCAARKYAVQNG